MLECRRLARHAVALGLAASCAGAAAADAYPPTSPCRLRGVEHEAWCGSLKRPLDPAQPSGPQIDIHYAILPALARNKRPDPVFFFAGGPGQSAIDIAGQAASLLSRFSNRRDVVLIDQRGVGRSAPLQCDNDDPTLPLAELFSIERQRARLVACRIALQALPHGDLRFFTTTIAMRDADAVRAAIGAERINLVGVSYGTRAVLEYQRLYPQRVRRAVLDGVAPPDMSLPQSMSIDNQAALDALFAACAADTACARAEPRLAERWRALLDSLPRGISLRHPLTDRPETLTLSRDSLLGMVRSPLYAPALSAALPAAIGAATRGRFDPLAALAQSLAGRKGLPLAAGMHFSVLCAEDAARPALTVEPAGADFGNSFSALYRAVCAEWPRGEVEPAFYSVLPAAAANLLLSGGLDPATPPRHAKRTLQLLGARARHVVVPNAGHGVMGIGCMRDLLFRFVDAETDDEALKIDAACVTSIPRPPMFELTTGRR